MDEISHDVTNGRSRETRGGAPNGRPLSLPADSELDALADLFLGPGAPEEPAAAPHDPRRESAQAGAKPVEGLVLGHLPVFAAAWPAQYARHRAEQIGGAVAIIRLSAGTLTIDLVGGLGGDEPQHDDWEGAVARAIGAASLVLLRVDEPAEAELAALPGLASLRMLSGADDAAIVGCYRKLKGLAATAEAEGVAAPRIELAILGAARERAIGAYARIARAAQAFLEAELPPPVVVERIGPTGSRSVFRGQPGISVGVLGKVILATAARGGRFQASRPAPENATLNMGAAINIGPTEEPQARGPAQRSRPAPTHAPVPTGDSLSALVSGLTRLESRCPLAERVELAADGPGGLHLVAALLSSEPKLSSRKALRDLLRAAAWARENRRLLAKAEPGLATHDGEPRLHLVTDRADVARALVGTGVRVHLAAPARAAAFGLVAISLED